MVLLRRMIASRLLRVRVVRLILSGLTLRVAWCQGGNHDQDFLKVRKKI